MPVWLANIKPLTRWEVCTYGERFASATWIEAAPHGMNRASCRSRIRIRDLWIWRGIAQSAWISLDNIEFTHVRRIDISLNDIEYRDVTAWRIERG